MPNKIKNIINQPFLTAPLNTSLALVSNTEEQTLNN